MSSDQGQTPGSDELGLWASLQLTLGRVTDMIKLNADTMRALVAKQSQLPLNFGPVMAATVPTPAGQMIVDLGAPAMGRFWVVRSLQVCDGANVRNPIAGSTYADWYIGKPPASQTGVPSTAEWIWTQQTLPAVSTEGSEAWTVVPQDHLFVVITGATTAGQQLLAQAQVLDYSQASYAATVNL